MNRLCCRKKQKTGLSPGEITRSIDTFVAAKPEDGFCATVDYEDIKARKRGCFTTRLDEIFEEGHELEKEIKAQLGQVKYEPH